MVTTNSHVAISSSKFDANQGEYSEYANLSVADTIFENNGGLYPLGGGLFLKAGKAHFLNTTFRNNTATEFGGAILV